MGKQLRILQSSKDVRELWESIPTHLEVGAIPRRMSSRPQHCMLPAQLEAESLLLFSARDWEEIRRFIQEGPDGCFLLSPRVGVVEWSPPEVLQDNRYVVGARIYFEEAEVPWNAGSSKLYSWMNRWVKKHYILVPAKRSPIAIGQKLFADIKNGAAAAIYPNGDSVWS